MGASFQKKSLQILLLAGVLFSSANTNAAYFCPDAGLIKSHIKKLNKGDIIKYNPQHIWRVQKGIPSSRVGDMFALFESGTKGGPELCVYVARFNTSPFVEEIELVKAEEIASAPKIPPAQSTNGKPKKAHARRDLFGTPITRPNKRSVPKFAPERPTKGHIRRVPAQRDLRAN